MYKKYTQKLDTEQWKQQQKDRVKEASNKLLNIFENGNAIKFVSIAYLERIGLNSDAWSLRNKMIMYSNGTTDARTYQQWLDVGRYVKKGTSGFDILRPYFVPDKENPDEKKLIGFAPVRVHPVENTEGQEIKYFPNEPKLPELSYIAKKWGLSVTFGVTKRGEYGFYNPHSKIINLSTENESVYFHELVHAAQYKLDGKMSFDKDSKEYKTQEVIAQFGACVLSDMYGFDVTGFSYHYIKGYLDTDEEVTKVVMKLLSKIQKILALIFEDANPKEETD